MDVSFSANTWKLNQIQNIDLKLEQQFYASTPYNLNDFKQTSKPPIPIFKVVDSNSIQQKNCLKKQLIKKQNLSLAIFVTYLYEFFHQVINEIQKKSNSNQSKTKLPSQSHLKVQKAILEPQNDKQSDRRLIMSPQKKLKPEEFEVLKSLKLKIYQIDLCKLKNIPQKFSKYYNNNLLKKIIFQYLSKALYNISLVQILIQSNEVLCFAISLVSQSLLYKDKKITSFNENQNFYNEVFSFLSHFDNFDDPCLSSKQKTQKLLLSTLSKQSKLKTINKKSQEFIKTQNFMNFSLTRRQMKSKYSCLIEERFNDQTKQFLYLLGNKMQSNKKIVSSNKINEKIVKQSPKKLAPSSKSISIKSQKKFKLITQEKGWLKYLGCLRYFFSDNPKN